MRLHVLSDLHMEGRPFTLPDVDADVLVLAGDITTLAKHGTGVVRSWAQARPVVYVAGNHEYYRGLFPTAVAELPTEYTSAPGLHILENAEWRFQDVRFLGCTLWTDFNYYKNPTRGKRDAEELLNDYELIRFDMGNDTRKLLPVDTLEAHNFSLNWLKGKLWDELWAGKTVVVTHHMPSEKSVSPEFLTSDTNPAFVSRLDYLFPNVDMWIHGHTHIACRYEADGCQVVCNPRGYNREDGNGFDARLVVTV